MKPKFHPSRVNQALTVEWTELERRFRALLDDVAEDGNELVVLKHGVPIARVSPIRQEGSTLRGRFKGHLQERGDVVHFDSSHDWEANR
jgi:prevent-host-death family protein